MNIESILSILVTKIKTKVITNELLYFYELTNSFDFNGVVVSKFSLSLKLVKIAFSFNYT